jgi:hypothetical protein
VIDEGPRVLHAICGMGVGVVIGLSAVVYASMPAEVLAACALVGAVGGWSWRTRFFRWCRLLMEWLRLL